MSRTKLGLGLGLEMHKTINRRTHRREVAIAIARATSPPSAADGGHVFSVTGLTIHGVTIWHNRGLGCVRPCVCVPEVDDVNLGLHVSY